MTIAPVAPGSRKHWTTSDVARKCVKFDICRRCNVQFASGSKFVFVTTGMTPVSEDYGKHLTVAGIPDGARIIGSTQLGTGSQILGWQLDKAATSTAGPTCTSTVNPTDTSIQCSPLPVLIPNGAKVSVVSATDPPYLLTFKATAQANVGAESISVTPFSSDGGGSTAISAGGLIIPQHPDEEVINSANVTSASNSIPCAGSPVPFSADVGQPISVSDGTSTLNFTVRTAVLPGATTIPVTFVSGSGTIVTHGGVVKIGHSTVYNYGQTAVIGDLPSNRDLIVIFAGVAVSGAAYANVWSVKDSNGNLLTDTGVGVVSNGAGTVSEKGILYYRQANGQEVNSGRYSVWVVWDTSSGAGSVIYEIFGPFGGISTPDLKVSDHAISTVSLDITDGAPVPPPDNNELWLLAFRAHTYPGNFIVGNANTHCSNGSTVIGLTSMIESIVGSTWFHINAPDLDDRSILYYGYGLSNGVNSVWRGEWTNSVTALLIGVTFKDVVATLAPSSDHHTIVSNSPALTQTHNLVVNDSSHEVTSTPTSLLGGILLFVAGTTSTLTSQTVDLTQVHNLLVDDQTYSVFSEVTGVNSNISTTVNLRPIATWLGIGGAASDIQFKLPSIALQTVFVDFDISADLRGVNNSVIGVTSSVIQIGNLEMDDNLLQITSTNAEITQEHQLEVQNVSHDIYSSSIDYEINLTIEVSIFGVMSEVLHLDRRFPLVIQGTLHEVLSEEPYFGREFNLLVEDSDHSVSSSRTLTFSLIAGTPNIYVDGIFQHKPIRVWRGSAWEQVLMYRWNGSEWEVL